MVSCHGAPALGLIGLQFQAHMVQSLTPKIVCPEIGTNNPPLPRYSVQTGRGLQN